MAYEFDGIEAHTKTRPPIAGEEERAVLAVADHAVRHRLDVAATGRLLDVLGLRAAAAEHTARRRLRSPQSLPQGDPTHSDQPRADSPAAGQWGGSNRPSGTNS